MAADTRGVVALGQRREYGLPRAGSFPRQRQVHLPCAECVGGGQGAVEHQVWPDEGEGVVLGAQRLALAEVHHHDGPAPGVLEDSAHLLREGERRAAATAQVGGLGRRQERIR